MDSIEVLAIELSQNGSRESSIEKKYFYEFSTHENILFDENLVGEYEMDFEHINNNIVSMVAKHQFKSDINEVTKAFIAIVDVVLNGNEDGLTLFCCECLFRWPNLSILPLHLEFDVLETAFRQESYISSCALAQLVIHCDKYKLEFLRRLQEFIDLRAPLAVGLLYDIQNSGQLYTAYYQRVMNTTFESMWRFDKSYLRELLMGFITQNIQQLNIDKTVLKDYFKDEDKQEQIISVIDQMVQSKILSQDDSIDWLNTVLEAGTKDCIELAQSIYCYLVTYHVPPDFHDYVFRLIKLSTVHPIEVSKALSYTDITEKDAANLAAVYPASPCLLSLFSKFKSDMNFNSYVASCFQTGNIEETLVGLKSIQVEEIPLIIDYVGKYETANSIILRLMKLKLRQDELEPYADDMIEKCIKGIDVIHSLEIISKLLTNKTKHASTLWPALVTAESSYERTELMMRLCELEEYQSQVYDHYAGWVPYLHEIVSKNARILDNLPMPLFSAAILHLTDNIGGVSIDSLLSTGKSHKVSRILTDYCIDSGKYQDIWRLVVGRSNSYPQEMAWRYCDMAPMDVYFICDLLHYHYLDVPSDENADKFLKTCYRNYESMRGMDKKYFGEMAAFLYNNTNVPLHIGFIKTVSSYDNAGGFLSELVNRLDSNADREVLFPFLVKCLTVAKVYHNELVDAIKQIDSSEEANVFCKSMLSI